MEGTIYYLYKKNNVKTNVIYNTSILVFILMLLSLPFVKVDVTTQNQGVITSSFENTDLYPGVSGVVKSVNLKNNLEVSKGDTLITIKSDALKERMVKNDKQVEDIENQIHDLELLLKGSRRKKLLKTDLFEKEQISFYQGYNEMILREQQVKREYLTTKQLFDKNVIPRSEYEYKDYEYKLIKSQKKSYYDTQMNSWQTRKKQLTLEKENLLLSSKEAETDALNYHVISPMKGIIINYSGIRENNFISQSQKIAEIAPVDSLIIECYVSPSDIGYIKLGQKVKFQIDSYDYNQWGFAHGTVIDVHINPDQIDNQSFFKIKCSLDEKQLTLRSGQEGKLKKGMTVRGRFFLAERSLYNLLFDRVDNWFNPKK